MTQEPIAYCERCFKEIYEESELYEIRGNYVCRECMETEYEVEYEQAVQPLKKE